mgnify:CR=1 FL=1
MHPFFVIPLSDQRALVADYGQGKVDVVSRTDGAALDSILLPSRPATATSTMCRPLGMVLADDGLYVVDGANSCVLQFDLHGRHIRSFGGKLIAEDSCMRGSSSDLPLLEPYGCAYSRGSRAIAAKQTSQENKDSDSLDRTSEPLLYVVDSGRNRIVAFSSEGEWRFAFGSQGSRLGQLNDPRGIAYHADRVWVADMCNHRISVFSSSGTPLHAIGRHGAGARQLQYPAGVAISKNLLLVSEYVGSRISVLTLGGEFLHAVSPLASPGIMPSAVQNSACSSVKSAPPVGYLCAIGAADSCAVVADTNGAVHVFTIVRHGPATKLKPMPTLVLGNRPGFHGPRSCSGDVNSHGLNGWMGREERLKQSIGAPGLRALLACFQPGDVHALMPVVYADVAAHPERYSHMLRQQIASPHEQK